MATKTVTYWEDDLTGERIPDDDVVATEWSLNGRGYRNYLTVDNRERLTKVLAEFADVAEIVPIEELVPRSRYRRSRNGDRPSNATRATTHVDREQNRAVREWARRQGMTVSERGRIPDEINEAYQKAHASE